MQIQNQVQLKPFNTLSLDVTASHYTKITSVEDIKEALDFAKQHELNVLVLSGGSNMLLPQQINALVIHIDIQGIQVLSEDQDFVRVKVGAGQVWHDFVLCSTQQNWFGLQNLALIPGLVGKLGETQSILAADCHFSYRHSIFKDDPTRYIITHVTFKLLKQPHLKLNYGDLKEAVGDNLTAENLQNQVIRIRQSKLPDPKEYPNVGSFFKNPIVSAQEFERLITQFSTIPHYPQANGNVKIAAGWLIDQAGWKGKQLGVVGMFHKQALVLVNYANASLGDVKKTYQAVQHDVDQRFHVMLEPEPVLYNSLGLIENHTE